MAKIENALVIALVILIPLLLMLGAWAAISFANFPNAQSPAGTTASSMLTTHTLSFIKSKSHGPTTTDTSTATQTLSTSSDSNSAPEVSTSTDSASTANTSYDNSTTSIQL